jgi:hypothetical protein
LIIKMAKIEFPYFQNSPLLLKIKYGIHIQVFVLT